MAGKIVCFYVISTELGGAERSLLELLGGLKANKGLGFAPWVLLPKCDGPLIVELKKIGVEYKILPIPRAILGLSRGTTLRSLFVMPLFIPCLIWYLYSLWSLWRASRPDIIHTNAIKCHIFGSLLWPFLNVPIVWHLRDIIKPGIFLRLMRLLSRRPGICLLANSKATALPFLGVGKKVNIIYNGIDPDKYCMRPNRYFNQILNCSDQKPIIGIVGVLARWKGQIEFLRMAKALIVSGVRAYFVVIGDAIYDTSADQGFKAELHNEVSQLGIDKHVLFAGFQQDSVRAINGLDILVHASIRPEPFGRVIIEAMACGVPVVCAGAGGVLEIVEDKKTGLVFEPCNTDQMALKVRLLLENSELRKSISSNALDSVRDRFTLDSHVKAVAEIYTLISLASGPPGSMSLN